MNKGTKDSFLENISLPSSDDLRGRQSVRATFKLSDRAIEALSIVATHLGIKQKSLFDHLIEDIESLNMIAQEIKTEQFGDMARKQKTFVVSRKTLSCLDRTSRQFNAPRDALVEYSIQRLLPIIAKEREKHRKRKELRKNISAHLENGMQLLQKAQASLDDNDPVVVKLIAAMGAYISAHNGIRHFVDKGETIEEF
jgi:hypothetical protein